MRSSSDAGIAIVGGGCSGALVAAQLLRRGCREITIIEPREKLGCGLAYSTPCEEHLLNVPAAKMSALPDDPLHFLNWLRGKWPDTKPGAFIPRMVYGEYLNELLRSTAALAGGAGITHIRSEVTSLALEGNSALLHLDDGSELRARRAVLALGNPASSAGAGFHRQSAEVKGRLNASPWLEDALTLRRADETILLIGSGLTAVDTALALQNQSRLSKIYMLSRKGNLPQTHSLSAVASQPPAIQDRGNLRGIVRELRTLIWRARDADLCWRTVIDSLRPISNEIWSELPAAERKRFHRHLKSYWESHRHRMAPQIRAKVDECVSAGQIRVVIGRLQEVRNSGPALEAVIRGPKGEESTLRVDRVISCTGILENYTASPRPLIGSLVSSGLARANDLGIGFDTDESGALRDAAGVPSKVLFTLGPPRRGQLFETTAVPEIRVQAERLSQFLAAARD